MQVFTVIEDPTQARTASIASYLVRCGIAQVFAAIDHIAVRDSDGVRAAFRHPGTGEWFSVSYNADLIVTKRLLAGWLPAVVFLRGDAYPVSPSNLQTLEGAA